MYHVRVGHTSRSVVRVIHFLFCAISHFFSPSKITIFDHKKTVAMESSTHLDPRCVGIREVARLDR